LTRSLKPPLVIVNFKTYSEATGRKAVELASKAERASRETGIYIGVAPQFADIHRVAEAVDLPVYAQHIDPIIPGSFTGHVLAESVIEAGASGTLINHSERQLKLADVAFLTRLARDKNLVSCICASNPEVGAAAAILEPNIVSIEPPELIGTGVAVSRAKPEVVTETVQLVRKLNKNVVILCGAGISTGEDVAVAIKLGAQGVLVASRVVLAKDPYTKLCEFADATRKA
jgi:triosephosphate isomerase